MENSNFLMGTIPAHVLVALLPVLLFKEDVCETSPPLSKPLPVSQSAGNREKKRFMSDFCQRRKLPFQSKFTNQKQSYEGSSFIMIEQILSILH